MICTTCLFQLLSKDNPLKASSYLGCFMQPRFHNLDFHNFHILTVFHDFHRDLHVECSWSIGVSYKQYSLYNTHSLFMISTTWRCSLLSTHSFFRSSRLFSRICLHWPSALRTLITRSRHTAKTTNAVKRRTHSSHIKNRQWA